MDPIQHKRAAIYCRLSRDDANSTSIATQEADCRKLCELRGYEVVLVAIDLDVSGSVRPEDRAGFGEILAELHLVDVVVSRGLDRFSRVTSHFAHLIELLESHGATLADVQGQCDLTSPYGRFVAAIMVAFAQMERETIQQRILRSRVELRQGGKWLGGAAPYGYRIVPDYSGGKRLELDPAPAAVLREVVRRVTAGVTLSSEIDRLNRAGVLCPGDRRKALRGELPPPFPGYGRWSYSAVYELLRSEVLRGYRVVGKRDGRRVVRDASGEPVRVGPALLNDGEWNGLQTALDAAAQTNRRPRTKASLLLHVAVCGGCGAELYRNARTQRGKDSSYYACRAQGGCGSVAVTARLVEEHVEAWLLDHYGRLEYREFVLVGGSGDSGAKVAELRADVEELARVLVGLRGAAADAVAGQLGARQEALETALSAPVQAPRWELRGTGQTVAERWAGSDTAEKRLMLLEMNVRATVAPAKRRAWDPGRVHVETVIEDPAQEELDAILRDAEMD